MERESCTLASSEQPVAIPDVEMATCEEPHTTAGDSTLTVSVKPYCWWCTHRGCPALTTSPTGGASCPARRERPICDSDRLTTAEVVPVQQLSIEEEVLSGCEPCDGAASLREHLPIWGSLESPLACHARDRGFKSRYWRERTSVRLIPYSSIGRAASC